MRASRRFLRGGRVRNWPLTRAAGLAAALWSGGGEGAGRPSEARAGAGSAGRAFRIVMVSHGQSSDPFWSVVANGAADAARELGVQLEYQAPTSFDMVRMTQLIEAAVASRPAALAISVPDADALGPSVRAIVAAGIP